MDLARDAQMQQVLNVKPVKMLQKSADRFEGQLLKRSRFLGWKPVWVCVYQDFLPFFLTNSVNNHQDKTPLHDSVAHHLVNIIHSPTRLCIFLFFPSVYLFLF